MPSRAGTVTGHPVTTWELLTETDQKTAAHELDELTYPSKGFRAPPAPTGPAENLTGDVDRCQPGVVSRRRVWPAVSGISS